MPRQTLEVADIFRRYGDAYRQQVGPSLSTAQRRVMTAIETCRTAALGGHVEQCDTCGHQRIAYKTMTLAAGEFIRRFLLHGLPAGVHRIRYYGFLGARHRREKLVPVPATPRRSRRHHDIG
ncbi:MAG: transposase zinc-binding domain-containing protein [Burkholderiales bacterium]